MTDLSIDDEMIMPPREGAAQPRRAQEVSLNPFQVENGYIALPQGPGLGLELREEVLGRYPYREFPLRQLPTYRDEGP
jgi:L-alanine-DL-glutamate epimerase-like enolase superfamily enzyme